MMKMMTEGGNLHFEKHVVQPLECLLLGLLLRKKKKLDASLPSLSSSQVMNRIVFEVPLPKHSRQMSRVVVVVVVAVEKEDDLVMMMLDETEAEVVVFVALL